METLFQDIRYGCRALARNPGFAAVAILSLALGIGANTAIFSFIDTVLLRSLPVRNPGQLVLFGTGKGRGNHSGPQSGPVELFSWREYRDFQKNNDVFQDILAIDSLSARIYATFSGGAAEGVLSTFVSGNYFDVLGVKPEAGSFFDASMDGKSSAFAVLSDAFWARRFDRDPSVVGRSFRAGSRDYTVLGIAPRDFFGTRVGEAPDLWFPVVMKSDFPTEASIDLQNPQDGFVNIVGRLKPGVSLEAARANINVVFQRLLPGYIRGNSPANYRRSTSTARVEMTPAAKGLSSIRKRYEEPLIVLMIVVALVLLIACANVANLLVALGAKREREMALRLAIGAGRMRVMRQLLTEGMILSGAAAMLGTLLASGAGRFLVHAISTGPTALPLGFELDFRVLAFTILLSIATGLLFAMAPAIRAGRVDVISSLKEGKAASATPGKASFGRVMVIAQVALSLTLLIASGLLLRSFRNLLDIDAGFDRQSVLLFKIDSASSGYKQDQRLYRMYSRVEEGISRLPGVAAVSFVNRSFHEGRWGEGISVPGVAAAEGKTSVSLNFVTPGFFRTFRIPVVAGRALDARDNATAPLAAVINETFANRVFGGPGAAIGRTFLMSPLTEKNVPYTVVGVAPDVKTVDVRDKPENFAWLPLAQGPVYAGTVAVRVSGDAGQVSSAVRRAVHDIAPNLPIHWITTLADEVSDSLVSERAIAELSSIFAALALLLSAIGLYGTISFAVARRTGEIGIRLALGAERTAILRMVLKDAMLLVGAGTIIGLPLAFAAGRAMQSLLYGLSGFDIVSSALAIVALSAVAGLAGYLPARRAAKLDPMAALRYE